MTRPWRPTRGGDGGTAPVVVGVRDPITGARVYNHRSNGAVYMNPACRGDPVLRPATRPTADPHDRAHTRTDGHGRFYPAAIDDGRGGSRVVVAGATPRRYHVSHMSGAISFETVFDETHARIKRLERLLGLPRQRRDTMDETVCAARGFLDGAGGNGAGGNGVGLRGLIDRTTRQRMSAHERRLEREANRILAEGAAATEHENGAMT